MKEYKIHFRCIACNKLLAKTDGDTEIKCPRCGTMNQLKVSEGLQQTQGNTEPDNSDIATKEFDAFCRS